MRHSFNHRSGFSDTFWLQWHLTDTCNLRCRHCYHDLAALESERPLEFLNQVLLRYERFLKAHQLRGRIQFCGGEPLLSQSLFPLLRLARKHRIPCRVLSNGTLITENKAQKLIEAGSQIVQVSLDGGRVAHDAVRGKGSFQRALKGVRSLASAGVEVTVSSTLSQANSDQIIEIIQAAVENGAYRVAFSRFVPQGAGAVLRDQVLSAESWLATQVTMLEVARRRGIALMPRDPTFVLVIPGALPKKGKSCPETVSGCAAGYNGLAIEPDGTVYPCRRLPIVLGNIFEQSFDEIWAHPVLEHLRDRDALEGDCGHCDHRWICGGCRAIPYALEGKMMAQDPQCPRRAFAPHRALARARQLWHRFLRDNV